MAGVFITIEGVEGSGKSTQIQRLETRLKSLKLPAVFSKEPGGTPLGKELRSLLLSPHTSGETWCPDAELLLFYAD
ncbi:MAG: dTMP kinase, partial [Holophaga sp.]|nr:dTMP kinase [Holophaga sp.]